MEKNALSRRHFIRMTAITSGSVLLLPACVNRPGKSSRHFFTETEASLVDAIAEQMIPADEWPGGKDAGVTNFIDKQLTGPYARYQGIYREGLALIRQSCIRDCQKTFEELSWEEQTLFLEKMEAGKMDRDNWEEGFDRQFFGLIRKHALQGYYGSPRHGGNKNYISYRMLRLDYPHIIGQNRYQL